MRLLGIILAACIMLAVLQAAISLLVVAGAVLLLWGLYARPRETFSMFAFLLFANVLMAHPWPTISGLCVVFVGTLILQARDLPTEPESGPPRLPPVDTAGEVET